MENKQIENFFQENLINYQESLNQMELERVNNFIRYRSFYRWSFLDFNIYYALAIFSGLIISVVLGSHYLFTHIITHRKFPIENAQELLGKKDGLKKENVLEKTDKIESAINARNDVKYTNPQKDNGFFKNDKLKVNETNNAMQIPTADSTLDNNHRETVIASDTANMTKNNFKKNIVYVLKRDTIFLNDTVRVKNPKRNRKK